jgi:hypothetical protein
VSQWVPQERSPRFASSPSSKEKKGKIIISLFVEKWIGIVDELNKAWKPIKYVSHS